MTTTFDVPGSIYTIANGIGPGKSMAYRFNDGRRRKISKTKYRDRELARL
jgi:hypothetical protein